MEPAPGGEKGGGGRNIGEKVFELEYGHKPAATTAQELKCAYQAVIIMVHAKIASSLPNNNCDTGVHS